MVKFLIHRPIAVCMAFLAFLLIGIATTTNLPVSLMPDIDIPVISVRIPSSEMPARQMENTIVKKPRPKSVKYEKNREIFGKENNIMKIPRKKYQKPE